MTTAPYADHPGLAWLREFDAGAAWLASLETVVVECAAEWNLVLGAPFDYAFASLALRVQREDGTPAVLKVQFPDAESEHEAAALAHWAGDGAVRLLEWDAARRALVLERCIPGTPLAAHDPGAALGKLTSLVARLAVPAGSPFRTLEEEAAAWAATLERRWRDAGQPFERRILDAAMEYLSALPGTQGAQVLVHQDLHAGNVLRAEREPWLAIDPKPLVGEREFAAAPIVRGAELGHDKGAVLRRLDAVCDDLGIDRERARAWTVVQTLAWGVVDDGVLAVHLDVARWLLEDG